MKKMWKLKKSAEAVSPVIATILMVAITVVLAAVLYVMVMGFGGNTPTTPTTSMTYQKTAVAGQYRITLLSISATNVKPSEATIIVTPTTGGSPLGQSGWTIAGGTYMGAGDYFLINSTVVGTQYSITLRYTPSSGSMGSLNIVAS